MALKPTLCKHWCIIYSDRNAFHPTNHTVQTILPQGKSSQQRKRMRFMCTVFVWLLHFFVCNLKILPFLVCWCGLCVASSPLILTLCPRRRRSASRWSSYMYRVSSSGVQGGSCKASFNCVGSRSHLTADTVMRTMWWLNALDLKTNYFTSITCAVSHHAVCIPT